MDTNNYCDICLVILTSESTKHAHFNSKMHLTNQQFKEKLKKNQLLTQSNCTMCCKGFNTFSLLEIHLNTKQHQDKLSLLEHINKYYKNIGRESNKKNFGNNNCLSKSITVSNFSPLIKDFQTSNLNQKIQNTNTFKKTDSDLNLFDKFKKLKTFKSIDEENDNIKIRRVSSGPQVLPLRKKNIIDDENRRWELIIKECEKLIKSFSQDLNNLDVNMN
jgi:hypothetical protein